MNWDYIAGFIDGEGSIIIKPPRIRIYISNTDKKILEEIKNFVKCGNVYEINRKIKNKKWKRQFGWTICNHFDVLRILKELENRLVIKKDLCEIAIKYIGGKRWQRNYLTKEELEPLRKLPSRKSAEKLGVSQFSILKYLKKYKLR